MRHHHMFHPPQVMGRGPVPSSAASHSQAIMIPVSPNPSLNKRQSSETISLRSLFVLILVIVLIVYFVSFTLGPVFLNDDDDTDLTSLSRLRLRQDRFSKKRFDELEQVEQQKDEQCHRMLESEKHAKSVLQDQLGRLENELSELRLKHRELESDYRELILSTRAQQLAKPTLIPQEDVSAVQRLAKCRTAVDESTQTIRDLREHTKNLENQVTRLQKDLREAISDADQQESIALECEKKRKLQQQQQRSYQDSQLPPPPIDE